MQVPSNNSKRLAIFPEHVIGNLEFSSLNLIITSLRSSKRIMIILPYNYMRILLTYSEHKNLEQLTDIKKDRHCAKIIFKKSKKKNIETRNQTQSIFHEFNSEV